MAASEVNVWFRGKWYGPSYPDAGDLPADRTPQAPTAPTAPVMEVADEAEAESRPAPPPKAGLGSSRAKWAAYADAHDVSYDDDATRDDIIDACEAAGVPVD